MEGVIQARGPELMTRAPGPSPGEDSCRGMGPGNGPTRRWECLAAVARKDCAGIPLGSGREVTDAVRITAVPPFACADSFFWPHWAYSLGHAALRCMSKSPDGPESVGDLHGRVYGKAKRVPAGTTAGNPADSPENAPTGRGVSRLGPIGARQWHHMSGLEGKC
jgi:hypothetical protein